MKAWLPYKHNFLDECIRSDGWKGHSRTCHGCKTYEAVIRCKDCFGGFVYCQDCAVRVHTNHPLHTIEVSWFLSSVVRTVTENPAALEWDSFRARNAQGDRVSLPTGTRRRVEVSDAERLQQGFHGDPHQWDPSRFVRLLFMRRAEKSARQATPACRLVAVYCLQAEDLRFVRRFKTLPPQQLTRELDRF